ncbi:MAG: hypothetical protein K6D97_08915 [Clostridia bacterium]|nr:hypothetical protein [Clostridia bacterium]
MSIYIFVVLVIACVGLCLTYFVHQNKKQLDKYVENNKDVAVIQLANTHKNDENYAEENVIMDIDGLKVDIFDYKPGVPAVCITSGNHILKVKSGWKVREKRGEKNLSIEKTIGPMDFRVDIQSPKIYSLNYNIKNKEYEFVECENN